MSITKITVEKKIYIEKDGEYVSKVIKEELSRESFSGDFDLKILQELGNWEIINYAENYLDMIAEEQAEELYSKDPSDFCSKSLKLEESSLNPRFS